MRCQWLGLPTAGVTQTVWLVVLLPCGGELVQLLISRPRAVESFGVAREFMNSPNRALFLLDGLPRLVKRGGGHLGRAEGGRGKEPVAFEAAGMRLWELDLLRFDVADGHSHIQTSGDPFRIFSGVGKKIP